MTVGQVFHQALHFCPTNYSSSNSQYSCHRGLAQHVQMKLHYQGTQSLATLVTDGLTNYSETLIECFWLNHLKWWKWCKVWKSVKSRKHWSYGYLARDIQKEHKIAENTKCCNVKLRVYCKCQTLTANELKWEMLHHQIWHQGDNMLHHLSFSSISNIIMPAAQIPDDKVVHFVGVQDFIKRHTFHKKKKGMEEEKTFV